LCFYGLFKDYFTFFCHFLIIKFNSDRNIVEQYWRLREASIQKLGCLRTVRNQILYQHYCRKNSIHLIFILVLSFLSFLESKLFHTLGQPIFQFGRLSSTNIWNFSVAAQYIFLNIPRIKMRKMVCFFFSFIKNWLLRSFFPTYRSRKNLKFRKNNDGKNVLLQNSLS
jgi:hypothetical protein